MSSDRFSAVPPRTSSLSAGRSATLCAQILSAALMLGILAPAEGWAQVRFMVGGEEQARKIRPASDDGRQDWRNTLSGQRDGHETAPVRRRMTEEERSDLRRHMRDAARGAYREEPPRSGPQR